MRRTPSVADVSNARPGVFAPLSSFSRRVRASCTSISRQAITSRIRHHTQPLVQRAEPLVLISRQLSRRSLQVLNAVAGGVSQAQQFGTDDLTVDLDWQPSLGLTQEVICWSCAAAAVCLVYVLTAPAGFSLVYATAIGLLFGLLLNTLRSALLEEMYKARERIEADLGDANSRFRHLASLQVHVKVCASSRLPPPAPSAAAARLAPPPSAGASGGPVPAIHAFHGFGSNTWSWSLVQQQLADTLGALVTSHDMPGFGLTQRPTDLSGFTLAFNGRLGRLALDYELAVRGLISQSEAAKSGESNYPHTTIHATAEPAAEPAAEQAAVGSLEAAAGGSAQQAAQQAVQQGLEPGMQAAAAAAAQGSTAGVVKAGAAAAGGSGKGAAGAAASAPPTQQQQQQRAKRVLMGHSLGGACAALEFISNPRDYAAVVLSAPAIIAGGLGGGVAADGGDNSSTSGGGVAAVRLEELQDGTFFTRSMASGDYVEPSAAAAAAAAAGAADDAAERARRDSSSSEQLDQLAVAQGNVSRSSSVGPSAAGSAAGSSVSSSAGSDSEGEGASPQSSSRRATKAGAAAAAAAAAGSGSSSRAKEVVVYATRGDDSSFEALLSPSKPKSLLGSVLGRAASFAQTCSMLTALLIISVLRPAIVALMRNLVRSRTFWANTLKQAYYDQTKVTPAAVDAYRLPQLVKGWETGMIQFLLARLGAGGSRGSSAASAAVAPGSAPPGGLEDAGLALRFAAAVAANNTPVLIVHGAADRLVPVSNSFKLCRLLKGCRLAVVKRAGHCPQEELPELYTDLVSGFLCKHAGLQG